MITTHPLFRFAGELAQCKKSLQDFLDGKRQQFPRFYFVSEADLLDLLSNASQPANVMKHITKVFLAVRTLKLTDFGEGQVRR
jgi:dynein heavy chain|tara:strand:+ start:458 stop:706 length:249 start_codon:yes stop_codon:yes gene_type:complete